MITKLVEDDIVKHSPTCGERREILSGAEYSPDVVIFLDIGPTTAHFHKGFDEIYFVLDGNLILQTYEPETGKTREQNLAANELCVVAKGVHHKITASSTKNRLCVLTIPHYDPNDVYVSEVLEAALAP